MDYEIHYKKGAENLVADALSRRHERGVTVNSNTRSCLALSAVKPGWIEELLKNYEGDPQCQEIMSQLLLDSASQPFYTLTDGILRYQEKMYVGTRNGIRNKLFTALHASAIGGNSG